jgi:UDP-N-acetylmuramoyl-tripeptide--D-alanyl-D-alanine ligase
MKPLSFNEIRAIVGGRPLTAAPETELFLRRVCSDTRALSATLTGTAGTAVAGCLFVAIKGENHDANDFVPQLRSPEVAMALVEKEVSPLPAGVYVLQVGSTRAAMGKIAAHVRSKLTSQVIAVGGSNGKTSTKHLIDAALRRKLRGSVSPKSFNNDIGVPTTLFSHDPTLDYIVLEMGTNHHGELKVLSDMAEPDIAVITSISHEHLEGLGDLTGVRREESTIISGLRPKGLLVVNGDDPELMPFLAPHKGPRVTFGFGSHNDLYATDVRVGADGTRFKLNNNSRREVFVPLLGRHSASNALAAIAVARKLGLNEDEVFDALAHATGPEMRQELRDIGGISVLNDAYNANPASVRAALETMMAVAPPSSGRRVAVLGEMRELGEASDALHREVGEGLAGLALDWLVFVGEKAKLTRAAAIASGVPTACTKWFESSDAAAGFVTKKVARGDMLLLKGSRGVRLERISEALKALHEPASLPTATKRAAG